MVGSLKLVGEGKWTPRDFRAALDAAGPRRCGPLAPPEGLYLVRVDYEPSELSRDVRAAAGRAKPMMREPDRARRPAARR